MNPSFALFAVLLDAPTITRTMCVPTNMTAAAQSPVLTCCRYSVACVVKADTLQVTANNNPGGRRHHHHHHHHLPLFVYPPFQELPRRRRRQLFVLLPELCLKLTTHNNNKDANYPLLSLFQEPQPTMNLF
jgi:hypothetical protein